MNQTQIPLARSTDPFSSFQAADKVQRTGTAVTQREIVLDVVRRFNGLTSNEMVEYCELDRYQIARRLPDLEKLEKVRKGPRSPDDGCVTWYPVEDVRQGKLW